MRLAEAAAAAAAAAPSGGAGVERAAHDGQARATGRATGEAIPEDAARVDGAPCTSALHTLASEGVAATALNGARVAIATPQQGTPSKSAGCAPQMAGQA